MGAFESTYLPEILHDIAMGLLIPAMVAIIILMLLTLFFLGQVIVEFFCERRHFKQNMPKIVNQINDVDYQGVTDVVVGSQLLKYQKAALVTISQNMGLPEEPLFSLAQIEIARMEKRYQRRLAWTDTISKVAPLLGLMGTLIPLGPGIVALGQGDVAGLSKSMELAFDATVCGLVCAIVALIVSKIRGGWYDEYVRTLESLVGCVVDKADVARKQGVQLPANYCGDPLKEFVVQAAPAANSAAADPADPAEPKGGE
ncbi:MAG: MotA/TolQ/ExbB proton channel family protein [Coriobacteriia bacterium]|nr:MotA/TolQ/ExbB proton channel family protein [Coriobacteriia bacterium]